MCVDACGFSFRVYTCLQRMRKSGARSEVEINGAAIELNTTTVLPSGMGVQYDTKHYAAVETTKFQVHGSAYDLPRILVTTPVFTFEVEAPPTFAQRLDVNVRLHLPLAELEGSAEGLLGHTIRVAHPLGATAMEQVYNDTVVVLDDDGQPVNLKYSAQLEADMQAKYRLPSLLSDDFPLNRFVPDLGEPTTAARGEPANLHRVLATGVSLKGMQHRHVYAAASFTSLA